MDFYTYLSRVLPFSPAFASLSFGNLADRAKEFFTLAVSTVIGNVFSAIFTFFFVLVGILLGAKTGALIGKETESGFIRGAAVGAITGVVFSLEVSDSSLADESLIGCLQFLIDVIASLLSGRLVRERLGPAILSVMQRQMGGVETAYEEASNFFNTGGAKGLPGDSVEWIPKIVISSDNNVDASGERVSIE